MNYNLVIVNDDEFVLFLHSYIIQDVRLHKSPKTFNSAPKALDFFATLAENTTAILLFSDVNMPVMYRI